MGICLSDPAFEQSLVCHGACFATLFLNMASHQAICFHPSFGDILVGCEENVQERAAAGGRND